MYKPIKGGSSENIQGYIVQLPPEGYGKNRITGELEFVGVIKNSPKASEQIWKRIALPDDWDKRRRKEKEKQLEDVDYYDPELETVRQQFWQRRLCGIWVMINGRATYIPPSYFFYLNFCVLDIGYPYYRDTDRKFFSVWEYCCEDPRCGGLVDIERRRQGKTYKMGSVILDRASSMKNHHAGIQSKTSPDAKQVFQKAIVGFFKKLPDFFRPTYDTSKGITPTSELRFFQTTVKGKRAEMMLGEAELESWIDWGSSERFHYDGAKISTYGMDEFGKTINDSVWERWNVVRFCLDQDGKWCGKAILTSTIEEMESGGEDAKKIWDSSNPDERDKNGRTKSGLYRFFLPAYETTYFDKFGMPEVEKAKVFYMNQREGLKDDPHALSSIIRKTPFSIDEAFRIDGSSCIYNPEILNARRDELSWNDSYTIRGNFEWVDGKQDTTVEWRKASNGRWLMCSGFQFDNHEDKNNIIRHGNILKPGNKSKFVCAADGFDHDVTQDDQRRSNAASHILKKHVPGKEDDPYNNAFVTEYCYRPQMSSIFYEDMIKQCVYFGCDILPESNKPGIIKYFKQRGYEHFLILLPGYKDVGIPSTTENKKTLAELTEEYIVKNINKVYFIKLIEDWLEFNLLKTQKYDRAMSAGWGLVADSYRTVKKNTGKVADITDYFRMNKVING